MSAAYRVAASLRSALEVSQRRKVCGWTLSTRKWVPLMVQIVRKALLAMALRRRQSTTADEMNLHVAPESMSALRGL